MILFLQNKAEGKRGGELTTLRIHMLLKNHFKNVQPDVLSELSEANQNPIKHMFDCLKLTKKTRPRLIVVDVSSGVRNLLAVRWMKKKQRRVMVIMLGQRMTFRYNNFIIKFLVRYSENFLLRKADIILVNSEFSARVARNRTSNKIEIIVAKPGFELTPSAVEIKRHSDTPTRLLFVGECTKVKGLIYLIKAMSMMTDIELTLNIAGNYNIESAYYKKIITIVNRYHLNDVVNFLGFVDSDSLQNLYRKSTIYVMPSLSEGYGKSLAEAMSFGLPAVASNAGAIPEMVEDKVNAILVEPKNPEALADGIRQLARDGELRREMGRANLDKAGTFPTWDSFSMVLADQLVPVIKKLLNE